MCGYVGCGYWCVLVYVLIQDFLCVVLCVGFGLWARGCEFWVLGFGLCVIVLGCGFWVVG